MKAGDRVWLTGCDGARVLAVVVMASGNGRSLFLSFDGLLDVGECWAVGCLPVLRDDAGVYRDLVHGEPVTIELERSGLH